jgi:K+-transporting ATPase A subunit
MKQNMGNLDKVIRLLVAAGIGAAYINGTISGTTAILLLAVAGIFILTSLIGVCPLYLPFKISTKKK